jgi:hypothetical protein
MDRCTLASNWPKNARRLSTPISVDGCEAFQFRAGRALSMVYRIRNSASTLTATPHEPKSIHNSDWFEQLTSRG